MPDHIAAVREALEEMKEKAESLALFLNGLPDEDPPVPPRPDQVLAVIAEIRLGGHARIVRALAALDAIEREHVPVLHLVELAQSKHTLRGALLKLNRIDKTEHDALPHETNDCFQGARDTERRIVAILKGMRDSRLDTHRLFGGTHNKIMADELSAAIARVKGVPDEA